MKKQGRKKEGRNSRISREMISSPEDDLKHTVHVGIDGTFFGDVSFLGDKAQEAKIVNKKIEKYHQLPRRSSLKRPSLDLSGRGSPLLEKALDAGKSRPGSEQNGSDIGSEDHTDSWSADSRASLTHKQENLHDISNQQDEFNRSRKESFRLSTFDLGPSLMDEVFKALGNSSGPSSLDLLPPTSPEPHTTAQLQQTTALIQDNDHINNVEAISPTDECSIDSAIDMTHEIASKSTLELDNLTISSSIGSEGPESPSSTSSPTEQHGSIFYVHSLNSEDSPKVDRNNISSEVAASLNNQMTDEDIENV